MRRLGGARRLCLLAAVLAIGTAAPAAAEERNQYTIFGGLRMSWNEVGNSADNASDWLRDNASFGLGIGFPQPGDRVLEVIWSHQETRVGTTTADGSEEGPAVGIRLDTVGVGGTYESTESKAWRPFVSGTGGLTVMSPKESGYAWDSYLTLTIGAGAKVPLSPKVGLRFEGRGYLLIQVSGVSANCNGGQCITGISGGGFGQFEVLAGVYWSP